MKTGVLVHGFHLQAKNWKHIVWGEPPDLLGRIPRGVLVALEEKAEVMVFSTGASEKDGKKEAEYTRDYLLEHFSELAEFPSFRNINLEEARKKIEQIMTLELESQNTAEEVAYAGRIFQTAGVEKVILVSSPTHISRCLRDAYVVFSQDGELRGLNQNLFATPSQTDWADPREVVIIEPLARPDMPLQSLTSHILTFLFKRLYKFPKRK